MNVNIVKNETGQVVATFENQPEPDGPFLRPVLKPGHTIEEVEAEENYMANIKAFYKRHSR